jgi:LmbE family N-acetylglucosaminyl deacetylase
MNGSESGPLRVIVVGAHPDEADMYAGGLAALFAEAGHEVKFLSLTCGDAGHHEMGRFALAARRKDEADEAARQLGLVEYEVLDAHDGDLVPTLDVRHRVMRAIREWRADVVIGFHPDGGGHPDNRAAGVAVRDAMSFVALRNSVPETSALKQQPVYLWMVDYATQSKHRHDLTLDVTSTIEKKLLACDAHATQFYEFAPYERGFIKEVPEGWDNRRAFILKYWPEFMYASESMKPALAATFGVERANVVEFAESFQFADGSRRPGPEELVKLFPMLATDAST